MSKTAKSYLVGRNSKTGMLTTVREARSHPSTHVVERIPKPGYGDSVPRQLRGITLKKNK